MERAAKAVLLGSLIYLVAEGAIRREESLIAQLIRLLSD